MEEREKERKREREREVLLRTRLSFDLQHYLVIALGMNRARSILCQRWQVTVRRTHGSHLPRRAPRLLVILRDHETFFFAI